MSQVEDDAQEGTPATTDTVLNRVNDTIDTVHELIELVRDGQAQIGNAVHKTGDEIIAGEKTFTTSPLVPTPEAIDASQKVANMAALARVKAALDDARSDLDAVKATAEAAATQTALDAVKATANAALSRSGGEMSGPVSNLTLAGLEALKYDAGAVSGRQVFDYAPQRITASTGMVSVFMGGDNASDTADLNNGRGLSADMPFATPQAAYDWAMRHFCLSPVGSVLLRLGASMTINGLNLRGGTNPIIFQGGTGIELVTTNSINVSAGVVQFQGIKVVSDNAPNLFYCGNSYGGNPVLVLGGSLTLGGSVTNAVIRCAHGATVKVPAAISGTVTGKKYELQNGATIITYGHTSTYIPGDETGTKDESSRII